MISRIAIALGSAALLAGCASGGSKPGSDSWSRRDSAQPPADQLGADTEPPTRDGPSPDGSAPDAAAADGSAVADGPLVDRAVDAVAPDSHADALVQQDSSSCIPSGGRAPTCTSGTDPRCCSGMCADWGGALTCAGGACCCSPLAESCTDSIDCCALYCKAGHCSR